MELDIDEALYERLARRAERQGFDSAEEYSAVILETVITELETEQHDQEVDDRLRDLGYLE